LRSTRAARKNADVRKSAAFLLLLAIVTAGCTAPATEFADKMQGEATDRCNQGNEAACHTIVQQVGETKVIIEDTGPIEKGTPACIAGQQQACQQMAVLHSELSSWCQMGNNRACGAVNAGPWPPKWDEPALIDGAKLSCLSGQFKPESHTCQALEMM
jgi:hypothetical protein